jgi:hypothetical protein
MNNQPSYFSDIKWALSGGSPTLSDRRGDKDMKDKIINSSRILAAVEKEIMNRL